ncbi:unnamed protein product [Leptosia nina]|uniref:Uncharacterized protein n=1 Tax=Leptosia nina TaxID=320188 RepID=A0AAV1J8W1_9NEOP
MQGRTDVGGVNLERGKLSLLQIVWKQREIRSGHWSVHPDDSVQALMRAHCAVFRLRYAPCDTPRDAHIVLLFR